MAGRCVPGCVSYGLCLGEFASAGDAGCDLFVGVKSLAEGVEEVGRKRVCYPEWVDGQLGYAHSYEVGSEREQCEKAHGLEDRATNAEEDAASIVICMCESDG